MAAIKNLAVPLSCKWNRWCFTERLWRKCSGGLVEVGKDRDGKDYRYKISSCTFGDGNAKRYP
jgi:hypothetical protein